MASVDTHQRSVFRYLVFSSLNTFHKGQQNDVLNEFYGVADPKDLAECNDKRPKRSNDPTDGTHCQATKKMQEPKKKD